MRAAIVGVVLAVCVVACTDSSSDVETRSASDHDPTSTVAPSTDPSDPTTPGGPPITAPPEPDDSDPSSPSTTEAPIDPDASGVGDAYFPDLGNPGLDVQRYDIVLDVGDDGGAIDGDVTLTITATEPLTSFTLDAVGIDVETVTVDDAAAEFAVESPELRIEPANPIDDGSTFVVQITYAATAQSGRFDPGSSTGWFRTETGSFVLNEPDGARTWLPSNDHPSDKAAYTFELTVGADVTGVANGSLQSHEVVDDRSVWRWDQPEPMATYLIQVLTGPFELVEGEGPNGLPLLHAVFADDVERMQPYFDVTEDMLEYFEPLFGPYPLDSYGLAMTDGRIGGALEEQGRSLFSREDFPGELDYVQQFLLSHELAHQWFGNAVTLARWRDIWLNEAFATYAEWLWLDHIEMVPLDAQAQIGLLSHQNSDIATGNPGVADLFASEVYDGGATVLHALRLTIGDDHFFELLQRWVADNEGESRTTDEFIALAEDISGTNLSAFVVDWLDSGDLPDDYP